VPDGRYPSQKAALARMGSFASDASAVQRGLPFLRSKTRHPRAIYLDGGFGVGKTHLLAATYHAVHGVRYYLSFAELAYTITRLGMDPALDAFAHARLLCIDEFELDDVAQTRMAAMFLRQLLERPLTHVVTTSNTLPSDLGQGRFAADAFQRDIGDIARAFEVVTIDGEDYRHRNWSELAPTTSHNHKTDDRSIEWPDLAEQLERVHPIHYAQIASKLEALHIACLRTIDDQAVALRLVHFVDKLYDQEVRLSLSSEVALADLFSPTYRHGGYEKKYRRCLSRLHELLAETADQSSAAVRALHSASTAPERSD
jgi:cell division protein ZapE